MVKLSPIWHKISIPFIKLFSLLPKVFAWYFFGTSIMVLWPTMVFFVIIRMVRNFWNTLYIWNKLFWGFVEYSMYINFIYSVMQNKQAINTRTNNFANTYNFQLSVQCILMKRSELKLWINFIAWTIFFFNLFFIQ